MANYAIYPFEVIRITQTYSGTTSHKPHTTGNYKDYPVDEGGKDTGKQSCYCPCDEIVIKRIYGVGNSGVNTIFWESTSEVNFADGTKNYMCGLFTHTIDSDLKNVKVGSKFKRGQVVCKEGTDGNVGMHLHMSFGKGHLKDNGWIKNSNGKYVLYCSGGAFKPEAILYIDTKFTTINSTKGLAFKSLPKATESFLPAKGYWGLNDEDKRVGKIGDFLFAKYPDTTPKAALGNKFGPNLQKAVKAFQKKYGLEQDGNVGPKTLAKMKNCGFKE